MTRNITIKEIYNRYTENEIPSHELSDVMCGEHADSISIEDINNVLFDAAHKGDSEAIHAIFDGAARGGEEIKRKLFEAKSTINSLWHSIPGLYFKDVDILKLLLEGVELKDDRYNTMYGTVLHWAMEKRKCKDLFQYLIKSGYPLNKQNTQGLTALNTACISGSNWAGIMLLEANVDVNSLNREGFCSLHYAVKYRSLKMMRKLIKHGADIDVVNKKTILARAVETRDCEFVKYLLEMPKFRSIDGIMKTAITLAVKLGQISMIEMILAKGIDPNEKIDKVDHEYEISSNDKIRLKFKIEKNSSKFSLSQVAILSGQVSSLITLLRNGANITLSELTDVYCDITDKIACVTFPSVLNHWELLEQNDFTSLMDCLVELDLYRCSHILTKYTTDNKMLDITEILKGHPKLLEDAGRKSEGVFLVLLNFVSIDSIQERPKIYHNLLDEKHFRGLKALLDKSMDFGCHRYLTVKFLSSTITPDSKDFVYPENSVFSHFVPSFLHLLKNCPDPKLRHHPIVNAVVDKKLQVYRWWYVLTFLLYSIFLSTLYYALIEASYQCDDMLFIYSGYSGRFRAVCEVVVLIYATILYIDEVLEFIVSLRRFWFQRFYYRIHFKALLEDDVEGLCEGLRKLCHLLSSLFKIVLKEYFNVFNIIDILGLVSLSLLVNFRLSRSPFQWTLASFTIIFFTLRLFKYTRIIPSLGAYVMSVFQIFIHDITRFAVIIVITLVAYFGGIHLASRQTFVSPNATTPLRYSENCSNNSFTGLFWFNQDRTSSYDLRRPLLSGVIFLMGGGPANEESALLDSSFLFTLLYLSFSFTIIVVMSNILIAQLSHTYAEITKYGDLPFKLDLVVSVEYESNLAFFFGNKLRSYTQNNKLKHSARGCEQFLVNSPQEDILLKIENSSETMRKDVKEDSVKQQVAIDKRMDRIEGVITQMLDILKNPTPPSTTY